MNLTRHASGRELGSIVRSLVDRRGRDHAAKERAQLLNSVTG